MKANKTIRWKVVDNKRKSFIVQQLDSPYIRLHYLKDKKTIAPMDSIGICCFDSKKRAKEFLKTYKNHKGKILKVKTYGRELRPKILNTFSWSGIFPEGTICYPAVMPLE